MLNLRRVRPSAATAAMVALRSCPHSQRPAGRSPGRCTVRSLRAARPSRPLSTRGQGSAGPKAGQPAAGETAPRVPFSSGIEAASEPTRREAMYIRIEDLDRYMRGKTGTGLSLFFGLTLASAGVAGTLTIYNNWGTIRRDLGTEAATVAHDVLADDQLLAQLEQLSKMLVHQLLKDETTLSTITTFVQQILANPDVNDSVLRIVLRVIHDERTVQQVVSLLQRVLAQPDTKDALVAVLANAMQDGLGKEASIEYVRAVVTAEATKELLSELAADQVSMVLSSDDTKQVAREFIETVLQDENLQKRSADVVWKIIKGAFWPGGTSSLSSAPTSTKAVGTTTTAAATLNSRTSSGGGRGGATQPDEEENEAEPDSARAVHGSPTVSVSVATA